jgi:HprK-related kinase A
VIAPTHAAGVWRGQIGSGSVLTYRVGPFSVRLRTPLHDLIQLVRWCYGTNVDAEPRDLALFNVAVEKGARSRRLFAPQAVFRTDSETPFQPFPRDHAFALLEWGLNWCIATRAHQYLMLHSAALERDGNALILPAIPGSGKSTLAAALALSGWRLLSDEFGLLDWKTGLLQPVPRAIPLKNDSIEIIRRFSSQADIGPVFPRTRKGDVAHLRPDKQALSRDMETVRPAWIVFPRYRAGSPVRLTPMPRHLAFVRLSQNAFNYRLIGAAGFAAVEHVVDTCPCWSAEYGDLDSILSALDRLPSPTP